MYLRNDATGEIGVFTNYQQGWSPAGPEDPPLPQPEIDAYLLEIAREEKEFELKRKLSDFQLAGNEYLGDIFCAEWTAVDTYMKDDLVLASDGKNYKSLKADNLDHEPPDAEWWAEFCPVFKTDDRTTLNILLQSSRASEAAERYLFRDKDRIKIDFADDAKWDAFAADMNDEKNRIMAKYNDYCEEIKLCSTVAEVEAISIDFSE